ncbi:ABC transporter ATP-binding protein [Occultella glacieicola]|uniref:ABC transporter ATP-binding protein n=1 Tax=Occultella glacieicola TaxID=2518684 RepID=A0ABY2E6V3_9MICO|nr:ATP-binding cassette domain-containing protein [Occultella glacieicola]TDE97281.1 ABC transporter ATP-binding protein [Occultella glacieicola]
MSESVATAPRPTAAEHDGPVGATSTAGAELLTAGGVRVRLGRREILHGVDLSVRAGEVVGLIGETGSGKTTFARAVLGLVPTSAGTITVGREGSNRTVVSALRGSRLRAFRRTGAVQYVFQDPLRSLDPDLTVGRSVGQGLVLRGGLDAARIETGVTEALHAVGLDPDLATRTPGQLSGGQRQRVAVARALAVSPQVLICDEPVSALDAAHRNHVLQLLDGLRRERELGLLLISHDLGSVAAVSDRVAVLYRGSIVEEGPTAQVLSRPEHPYTRMLLASAASLHAGDSGAAGRRVLRREVLAGT